MTLARLCAAATLMLSLPGCALFFGEGEKPAKIASAFPWSRNRSTEADDANAPVLPVARLEASIVSRPSSDSRIRQLVWEELDESGLMAPDQRQRLNASGFRVGVAGSATPWVLQSLARDAVAADRESETQPANMPDTQQPMGPSFDLMQNGKSILEVQSGLDVHPASLKRIEALSSIRDCTGMKCVLEIVAKEISDDGVLLSILPQIHSGAATTRLSVVGMSEQLPVRQNIIPLYEQQFSIRLHRGEVAVIGRQSSEDDRTVGEFFFRPQSDASDSECILMIRFVGIEKLRGQSDPGFRLNASGR